MTAFTGPFLIVCTILALGGAAKILSPQAARRAIRTLGFPAPLAAVRLLGLAEIALACLAGFSGGRILPSLVGVVYVVFAIVVVVMLRSGTETSCGCFGSASTPPSALHVVANLLSAAAAFGAIGIASLPDTLAEQPAAGVPLLGLVGVGAYATFLVLTALPVLFAPVNPLVQEFTVDTGRAP